MSWNIKGGPSIGTEEAEMARWKKVTEDYKEYVIFLIKNSLSEPMLRLLEISFTPCVPASLRNIPEKCNIKILSI